METIVSFIGSNRLFSSYRIELESLYIKKLLVFFAIKILTTCILNGLLFKFPINPLSAGRGVNLRKRKNKKWVKLKSY